MIISETASAEADLVDLYLSRGLDFAADHEIDIKNEIGFLRMYVDACLKARALSLPACVRLLVTHTEELGSESDWMNEELFHGG